MVLKTLLSISYLTSASNREINIRTYYKKKVLCMRVSKQYKSFCLLEENKQYPAGAESQPNEINKFLNSSQWERVFWLIQEQQKPSARATEG